MPYDGRLYTLRRGTFIDSFATAILYLTFFTEGTANILRIHSQYHHVLARLPANPRHDPKFAPGGHRHSTPDLGSSVLKLSHFYGGNIISGAFALDTTRLFPMIRGHDVLAHSRLSVYLNYSEVSYLSEGLLHAT